MARARRIVSAILAVPLWIAPLSAQAPTGTVRGRVTDNSTQQPLSGATVTVGSRGALTNADGRYVIAGIPAGSQTVRAVFLGYGEGVRTVTVVSGGTSTVDLALETQAIGLNAVVVVGYGQQKAGNITGAVKQVTASEFNKGQVTTPQALIESKIAGVQVVDNNAPGGGLSIRIRGATSVNASSEPLYVVDGIPLGNGAGGGLGTDGRDPLNFLNPQDIESITVLKDASAAAIYGANAANGVVLITTKTGRSAPHITYTTTMSSSQVTRVPDVLTAAQFRAAVQQYAPNRVATLGSANTDWYGLITRNAFGQQHNVAMSGAGEHNTYRFSLGYTNQDGVVWGSGEQRISLGVNFDQRLLSDNLDFKVNAVGSRTNDQFQAGDVLGNAVGMAPTQPVTDPTNATGYGTGYWDWQTTGASASNPVASLVMSTDKASTWRSIGNVQTEYRMPFMPALKAHVNVGYDATKMDRQTFIPSNLASQVRQGHGRITLTNNSQANTLFDAYLNYAAPLNVLPGNIDVTGGYSYNQSHSEYPYFQETGLSSNLLGTAGFPAATTVQPGQFVNDTKLISFFGRVNYNINDKYLLAASVRRDGSSRFGPSNAWGVFPAFSAAWRISQESFFKNMIPGLSDLKLRASYGKTGNQAFADYQQYPTYTYGNAQAQYQFGNNWITTIRPSAVDPNIKWEQTAAYDVGVDYGFLDQRVSGAVDWYRKNTSDLIFTVPVAAGTNFSNFLTTNIGSMRNQGIELSLSARVLEGGAHKLGYTADFNASHNANELTKITTAGSQVILRGNVSGGVGTTIQVLEPGQPINSFWVCPQYYQGGKPVEGKYVSLGDSVVSACDSKSLRAYHNPAPNWMLGHTSSFTYGKVDASFTLRAYLGNYVYNNVASQGSYNALTTGGSPSNVSASVLKTGFVTPQYLSDYYVEDGSFLRMDNATIGYSFRYRDQPIRLFATVQNAFTATGYTGVDPTAGVNGIDNNIYPRSRIVSGGLTVQF